MSTTPRLHVTEHGSGPPLVFLHGAWVSSAMWTPQRDHFADAYRVITIDLRGHGQSPGSTTPYSIDLFTDDLRSVLRDMNVDRPVLCGLSLGGLIARRYATKYPTDLTGLVLADIIAEWPMSSVPGLYNSFFFPRLPLYATIRAVGVRRWYRMLLQGIEATAGHRWLALECDARRYAFREVAAFSPREFINIFNALYQYTPYNPTAVTVPTILLHGDHETPVLRAQNRILASEIDGAHRTILPDAGHLSNLDNPGAFNSALSTFLTDIGL